MRGGILSYEGQLDGGHHTTTLARTAAAYGATVANSARVTELTLATYFSGPKVRSIPDNVPGARERAQAGSCCSARSTPGCCGR